MIKLNLYTYYGKRNEESLGPTFSKTKHMHEIKNNMFDEGLIMPPAKAKKMYLANSLHLALSKLRICPIKLK